MTDSRAPEAAEFAFDPLTPAGFLTRSASVFPERTAIVDGDRSFTYAQFAERSLALTGLLADAGIGPGDRVAALCTNSHVMLEMHHGVPLRGAVLVPLNIRLAVDELVHIVEHSGTTLLVATADLAPAAREVADRTDVRLIVDDTYEDLLSGAEPQPADAVGERDLLAINYTSGTTGGPKGVMYHHRGAYLQALAMAYHTGLGAASRYLWTLPMFHCNGWCFPWAVTAAGATHVCLRAIDVEEIWRLLRGQGITHYSAAPTVLSMIAGATGAEDGPLESDVHVDTGGAPPSPALLERLARLRMHVTHLYGLTETFGPLAINEWHPDWDRLEEGEQSRLRARQGVSNVIARPLRVVDETGTDVPADGRCVGEIVARGNDVMLGYYRDEQATRDATVDGWFRTGDLAVMFPDRYVEIRDRRKDLIVSGGENIASVEVEQAIDSHPAVLESAVVGVPDPRWGEVPVAYVTLRPGDRTDAEEITAHVRSRIAGFKVPKQLIFGELPKTSTGKIQKNVLRSRRPR
ncbi:MAG: AMP-binding protein [Nocardioidaceae bacterium]